MDTAMRVIFVNLPARDLRASRTVIAAPGIMFNPGLSGDQAACPVVDGNAFVVLLAEERLLDFINGEISDAKRTTEVLTRLPAGCGQQAEESAAMPISAGGKQWQPGMDEGPIWPIVPYWSFCRGYRCRACGAQATLYTARDRKTRVVVPHHRDCEFWKYISSRWPKLARGIRHNV